MRLATWNVNSVKARLPRLLDWLAGTKPDVVCLQETKCPDGAFPVAEVGELGYEAASHSDGRWNGVAILSRVGLADVVAGFPGAPGFPEPEARAISATCDGVRVWSVYVPNGRALGDPHYAYKLAWFAALRDALEPEVVTGLPLAVCGDFNVAPTDADVWAAARAHGGTHVSPRERAAFRSWLEWGLRDSFRDLQPKATGRFTWWDYRAGNFHKNFGMRIDHLLPTESLSKRVVAVEIDREARKGKPIPSDHAPLVLDLDQPGKPFDPGWADAEARIAARGGIRPR
jgi:exodeoxyribonuclease-3